MGKLAFLFPGQGSQVVGMGKDFYDKYDIAKNCLKKQMKHLDIPLWICALMALLRI